MTINEKNISVLFLTKYAQNGASSRYRSFQYLPYLEKNNINCQISPLFNEAYLHHYYQSGKVFLTDIFQSFCRRLLTLTTIKHFDLVVIEYEILPYCPAFLEYFLHLLKIPYIVDYDDALFHQYDQHPRKWLRWILGNKISTAMRYSNLVITGNDYLANYAQQAESTNVKIIPTVIDLERYPLKPLTHTKNAMFTIGWIGSPSTTQYLQAIAPALAKLCENGKVQVYLIGSTEINLPNVNIKHIAWNEKTEVSLLQEFDVGIMPLPNEAWAKGKCGFKLIQYMACSLPVIASPVGVNKNIVEQGINGFLASTTEEWTESLFTLYNDFNLRVLMGKSGRKKVEQQYCLQVTAPQFLKCLLSTIKHTES